MPMSVPNLRMRIRLLAVVVALSLSATTLRAQSSKEQVALGDRDYGERRAAAALAHYLAAITADPKNYDALCKASRAEVDVGEALSKGAEQDAAFSAAASHAERAVAANPRGANGHFALARAVGKKALSVGTMDRIRYAKVIRAEALETLKYDSLHSGGLHVLGMWNAEVMRLNGVARAFARTFLGADVFAHASWPEAVRLMEKAVAVDPERIGHHLDLGIVYTETGNAAKARQQFEWVARAPERDPNDALYKRRAADRLRKL
jgi:tetratricopeptide (TPR) repeat protein